MKRYTKGVNRQSDKKSKIIHRRKINSKMRRTLDRIDFWVMPIVAIIAIGLMICIYFSGLKVQCDFIMAMFALVLLVWSFFKVRLSDKISFIYSRNILIFLFIVGTFVFFLLSIAITEFGRGKINISDINSILTMIGIIGTIMIESFHISKKDMEYASKIRDKYDEKGGNESMNFVLPKANTHPEVAKEQHLIPRTYMRQWSYNSGDLIWIVEKNNLEKGVQSKNVDNINYKVGYHDIKAGDIFMPDEALNEIYGFLTSLIIKFNGKKLQTLRDMHNHYYDFDKWVIEDKDGKVATKKEKNEIFRVITQSRFTFVEEEWCYQFENNFIDFFKKIEQKLRCRVLATNPSLTSEEYEKIMEYLLIFECRNERGNEYINEIIDTLPLEIFDDIEIDKKERVHNFNETAGDELRHALTISSYYKYLKNRNGNIEAIVKSYLSNLGIGIKLTTQNMPFITSERASLLIKRETGEKEHIFVASPTMLITTFKKNGRRCNFHSNIKAKEVRKYNKLIAKNSNIIITKSQNINFKKLFI